MNKYHKNYIFKNACEIRLYQVGIIDIMKDCKKKFLYFTYALMLFSRLSLFLFF